MASQWGTLFRVSTFGESHGGGVGCVIDGCPPGIQLSQAAIAAFLGGDAAHASDLPARDAAGFDLGGILADLDRLAG